METRIEGGPGIIVTVSEDQFRNLITYRIETTPPYAMATPETLLVGAVSLIPELAPIAMRYTIDQDYSKFLAELTQGLRNYEPKKPGP